MPLQEDSLDNPTIEELAQSGRRLAILCDSCGRFRYMNLARFAADQRISTLAETLKCASCRSEDVRALAISRDPDTGFWPAERS
ncbi:hypothetical protein E1180_09735 [Roseibium denhamense]|uniref:Uncharacterized protein n=1 Tax=Roseibium denhamense TaxID=76305 RepID=A0ABY1PLZ1_9HYPH|nr:hypothetical protein [Roseibium denhamense]MTI05796.1 hypothetical protein [Roseibium denhamense]SMP37030.1 hypothetical protein SAMN06265374_4466 [Roseibium denhamense]